MSLDGTSCNRDAVTVIGYIASVHHVRTIAVDCRDTLSHEGVFGTLEVEVALDFETVVEEGKVDAKVDTCGLLPLEIGVGIAAYC